MLHLAQLTDQAHKKPDLLSGGQKQRVAIARASRRWQQVLLGIVPFWTSFLIRIFASKGLLHLEGRVKRVLAATGSMSPHASLLYDSGAVLLVLVYSYLPFAILPIYAAAEKFDYRLLEAARDLGARPVRAFSAFSYPVFAGD